MQIELIGLFFIVAFVYSSVGFGGGSSYLALLFLFDVDFLSLRTVALLCNVTVVTGSVFVFLRQGLISWKRSWPLILLSVPAAFIGGYLKLNEQVFFILLGITLFVASLAMFFQSSLAKSESVSSGNIVRNASVGGAIGFLSGLVGIGGGIFLSPVLHLMKWDRSIKIAAIASLYIFVNSIAGLLGQMRHWTASTFEWPLILSLMAAVFVGGQLGVRVGIFKFNANILKRVTATLVMLVSLRVLYEYVIIL